MTARRTQPWRRGRPALGTSAHAPRSRLPLLSHRHFRAGADVSECAGCATRLRTTIRLDDLSRCGYQGLEKRVHHRGDPAKHRVFTRRSLRRQRGGWEDEHVMLGAAHDTDAPLLGREEEQRLLRSLLNEVPTHGQALVLRGEPGVGKSRLISGPCGMRGRGVCRCCRPPVCSRKRIFHLQACISSCVLAGRLRPADGGRPQCERRAEPDAVARERRRDHHQRARSAGRSGAPRRAFLWGSRDWRGRYARLGRGAGLHLRVRSRSRGVDQHATRHSAPRTARSRRSCHPSTASYSSTGRSSRNRSRQMCRSVRRRSWPIRRSHGASRRSTGRSASRLGQQAELIPGHDRGSYDPAGVAADNGRASWRHDH
jgi:hypothetical protein